MARMIPTGGPVRNDSYTAEPDVYWRLEKLDDKFTVIHSLPWLCAAVKAIDKNYAPTGELDFIILHPELGILTLEVKGGVFKYDRYKFVYLKTNQTFDPIGQLRRGTFVLSKWLQNEKIKIPAVGYAWVFPEVDMKGKAIPPAFQDATQNKRVVLDKWDMPQLSSRIIDIMAYWQNTLNIERLSQQTIDNIVDLICPSSNYFVGWDARIEYDNKTWLALNRDQERHLKRILENERTVVSGRAGTGKTVLAIALARYLAVDKKRVLFLFYNSPIASKVSSILSDVQNIHVMTFHKLCIKAETNLGINNDQERDQEWFDTQAPKVLYKAIAERKIASYDAIIIDEGQVFRREWYAILRNWVQRIHAFCDETQVFPYEISLSTEDLVDEVVDADHAGILTVNMRSPRRIFERLDTLLPTNYEQSCPRQYEDDTLHEIVSFDTHRELRTLLRQLKTEGIEPSSIAIITTKNELKEFGESGKLGSVRNFAGTIETSTRVRGLEFPIVIVFEIGTYETSQLLNAYARATTRVIAIYSVWNFQNVDQAILEARPFLVEILKNPQISEALNDPWGYATDNLGWQLTQVAVKSVGIYWNHNLGVWILQKKHNQEYNEELWLSYLLLNTEYPIYSILAVHNHFFLTLHSLANKSYESKSQSMTLRIAVCEKCDKIAIENEKGEVICANCGGYELQNVPSVAHEITQFDDIISNPNAYTAKERVKVGLSLLALLAINKVSDEERTLLEGHIRSKNSARLGYQALLALTGITILKLTPEKTISVTYLNTLYKGWVNKIHHESIAKVIPSCINYWLQKKWLKKCEDGAYLRVEDITPIV